MNTNPYFHSQDEVQEQAKKFLSSLGIVPPNCVIFDGIKKYVPIEGKGPNDKTGRYIAYDHGYCQVLLCWNWRMYGDQMKQLTITNGRSLSLAETKKIERTIDEETHRYKKEQAARHAEKAKEAQTLHETAATADPNHPYLKRKGVRAYGIYQEHNGTKLLIFGRDINGKIWTYQSIDHRGEKRFLAGGRKTGTSHTIIGDKGDPKFIFCEGYSTAASIYAAIKGNVSICFDASNLVNVVEAFSKKYGNRKDIIICADDDAFDKDGNRREDNPGMTKAIDAAAIAKKITGKKPIIVPPKFKQPGPGKSDFNDLFQEQGLDEVKKQIIAAIIESTEPEKKCILEAYSDLPDAYIDWLWPGWMARGKLHIIAGPPGHGKTTVMMAFAAIISNGKEWPDGTQAQTGTVIIYTDEDDPADTLKHRLKECGADLSRVFNIRGVRTKDNPKETGFDPSEDIPTLLKAIEALQNAGHNVQLLILDPIISVVRKDSNQTAETRAQLRPLVELASQTNIAIFGITHFTKGTAGRDPVERVTGSLAFGALTRIVTVAMDLPEDGPHPPGARLFARAKSNIGPNHGGFYYFLEVVNIDGKQEHQTTSVRWGDYVEGNAKDLIASAEGEDVSNKLSMVMSWLKSMFMNRKTIPAKEVEEQLTSKGVKPGTWKEAKKRLKITSERYANGWVWIWPDDQDSAKSQTSDSYMKHHDFNDFGRTNEQEPTDDDTLIIMKNNNGIYEPDTIRVGESDDIKVKPKKKSDDNVIFHPKIHKPDR